MACFDEEPEDIHGECAHEIDYLKEKYEELKAAVIEHLKSGHRGSWNVFTDKATAKILEEIVNR